MIDRILTRNRKLLPPTPDRPCPSWCDMRDGHHGSPDGHSWAQGTKLSADREHIAQFGNPTVYVTQMETVDRGEYTWGPVQIWTGSYDVAGALVLMDADTADRLATSLDVAAQFVRTLNVEATR